MRRETETSECRPMRVAMRGAMGGSTRGLRHGGLWLALGVGLLLAGCTTPAIESPKVLDSMVGQSSVDVLRRFGVPTRNYQVQGHNFLSYIETDTQYSPGTSGWDWGWGGGYGYGFGGYGGWGGPGWGWGGGGIPASYYSTSCQTTFELVSDKVVGWKMHGDGC